MAPALRLIAIKQMTSILLLVQIVLTRFNEKDFETTFSSWENNISKFEEAIGKENIETFPTKIFIARRGQCTFVNKVRNAERAGASLLVVVDSRAENVTNVIMGDDGTGTGIRIPSMLIGKSDGEKLIEFAKT